jgi:hypothetical protein
MFDQFVGQVATRGWQLVVKAATSPGTQAAVKRYALQAGAAVTAIGAKKAADMAEGKIEELADRGNLSPKAAAVASGVVRAARFGITITAAAVGTVLEANEPVRRDEAVRGAAGKPATTAQPPLYLE